MKILRVGLSFLLIVAQLTVFVPLNANAEELNVSDNDTQDQTVVLEILQETVKDPVEELPVPDHKIATENEQIQPMTNASPVQEPTIKKSPLITEVQVSGACEPDKCTGNNAEFVEIFNPNDEELSLKGYSLYYQNSSGTQTQIAVFSESTVLQPKQFAIISRNMTVQGAQLLASTKTVLADSAGALVLKHSEVSTDASIVDQVAWGSMSAGFYGGKAAIAPPTNKSLQRCFVDGQLREYDPRSTADEFLVYGNELPTPGTGLQCEKTVPAPVVNMCEGVKINEIAANTSEQYIELKNSSTNTVDLNGCQLQTNRSSTKSYVFAHKILLPGGLMIVPIKDSQLTLTKTTSGVVYLLSSDGLSEADMQAYTGLAQNTAWAFFDDGWLQTYEPTPGLENVALKYLPCDEGYQRNEETGRCNKIVTLASIVDCGEGKYRSEDTGRCRAIPVASVLAACKLGQYRSEETNRCRNIVTASTQKPCKDNQYRSEETNRCRNIVATSVPDSSFAVQSVKEGAMAFVGWWALGGVGFLALSYAAWEWRYELRKTFMKTISLLSVHK